MVTQSLLAQRQDDLRQGPVPHPPAKGGSLEAARELAAGMMESITPGEAVTLEAGDAAYLPANSGGEIRNDGQELVVALGFLVVPPGGMMGEATPAP